MKPTIFSLSLLTILFFTTTSCKKTSTFSPSPSSGTGVTETSRMLEETTEKIQETTTINGTAEYTTHYPNGGTFTKCTASPEICAKIVNAIVVVDPGSTPDNTVWLAINPDTRIVDTISVTRN